MVKEGCCIFLLLVNQIIEARSYDIWNLCWKSLQSGQFGKLNKRVSFPETLDLTPYMSEDGDDTNVYKLYAVVVHVDMLNASFFGHYICYTKDFCGNWYRIDDCKVLSLSHAHLPPISLLWLLVSCLFKVYLCRVFFMPRPLYHPHSIIEDGIDKKKFVCHVEFSVFFLTLFCIFFQVMRVELEEVLSQGAYMLLYSRCLFPPSKTNGT